MNLTLLGNRGEDRGSSGQYWEDPRYFNTEELWTSEVFDPVGRAAPIVGGLKLDISTLQKLCVGWDDPIPTNLKDVWI